MSFSSTQVHQTFSGTKLPLFRVREEYRCKMATKSLQNHLLNRSANRRKIASVNGSLFDHTVFSVVDHTRCLGSCCMSRTCYRFRMTHINLFQITNLGRWPVHSALLTAGSKIFLPLRSPRDQFLFRFANYQFLFANYHKPIFSLLREKIYTTIQVTENAISYPEPSNSTKTKALERTNS